MTHASTREDEFWEKLNRTHPTTKQAYEALKKLIRHEHSLHIPPMVDDADMVISRVIAERDELQATVNILAQAMKQIAANTEDEQTRGYANAQLAEFDGTKESDTDAVATRD